MKRPLSFGLACALTAGLLGTHALMSGCGPFSDPVGRWFERYNCFEPSSGFCETESSTISITRIEGDEYEISSGTWSGTGTLVDRELVWVAFDPSEGVYNEAGVWTFDEGFTSFTKVSSYCYGEEGSCDPEQTQDGTCVGASDRNSTPTIPEDELLCTP